MRLMWIYSVAMVCVSGSVMALPKAPEQVESVISSSVGNIILQTNEKLAYRNGQTIFEMNPPLAEIPDEFKVLSKEDVRLYKAMFQLQRNLQRPEVAKLVPKLKDDVLMGHLIAERILHPKTKTPFSDMQKWMSNYPDHHEAPYIYSLAQKRKPRGASVDAPSFGVASAARYSDPDIDQAQIELNRKRYKIRQKLSYLRGKNMHQNAMGVVLAPQTFGILGESMWAREAIKVAKNMAVEDQFSDVVKVASAIVEKTDVKDTEGGWLHGYAYYRMGAKEKAISAWKEVVFTIPENSKYFSQIAWWIGRTLEEKNRMDEADRFYREAAADPYTFYGQLAAEKLGVSKDGDWSLPDIAAEDVKTILASEGMRRVIALAQIEEYDLAQHEFKAIYKTLPDTIDRSLLALMVRLHLPNSAMTMAFNLKQKGEVYPAALFPVAPKWEPLGGYKVDQALLHAIIRQESAFQPSIKSRVGARGLMQIMPGTSRYIQRMRGERATPTYGLDDYATNMDQGQYYLQYLSSRFDGNLMQMVAGYNGGPRNVEKWQEKYASIYDDPALFIENIPFTETREYVKKVLSNLWIYQKQMGVERTTLAELSDNRWPTKRLALAE